MYEYKSFIKVVNVLCFPCKAFVFNLTHAYGRARQICTIDSYLYNEELHICTNLMNPPTNHIQRFTRQPVQQMHYKTAATDREVSSIN